MEDEKGLMLEAFRWEHPHTFNGRDVLWKCMHRQ